MIYDGQAVVFIDQLFNQQLRFDAMIKPKLDNFAVTINYQLNEGEREKLVECEVTATYFLINFVF